MVREHHRYVNLDKKFVEIIDSCVANIFSNGEKVYSNRKDFVTKACQQLIDREKAISPRLERILEEKSSEIKVVMGEGNRILAKQKHVC